MKKELLDTILLSEKRKKILLMLMDGPTTVDDIKGSLTGTTSAIMAQVKILLEQGLIEQRDDQYRLTYIGGIITKKISPLIKILDVVGVDKEYWQTRDLSAVPENLLDRIGDLGKVMVHEADLSHLFEPPKELLESLKKADNVSTVYSYFCPTCPRNYSHLAKKETNFDLVLTRSVYERLKEEYTEQYNEMMASKNSNLYVCDDELIKLGGLSVTDDITLMAFFDKEGHFDHKKIISYDESALQWSNELFSYYKQLAEQVK